MFQSGLIWNFIDKVPIWVQGQGWFLWLFGKKAQSNMFGYTKLATGLCGPHSSKPRSQFFWSCSILELYLPFFFILFVTAISTPFFREHFFSTSHLLDFYYYNIVKLQLQPQPYSHAVLHLFLLFSYPRLFCFILVYRLK